MKTTIEKCPKCRKLARRRGLMAARNADLWYCPQCDHEFETKIRSVPAQLMTLVCIRCGLKCRTQSGLSNHLRAKHGVVRRLVASGAYR